LNYHFHYLLICLLLFPLKLLNGSEPGELVVALQEVELSDGKVIVDKIAAGQVLRVLEVRDKIVLLSRGKPGWANQNMLLSINQAEKHFASLITSAATSGDYLARGTVRVALGNHEAGLADIQKASQMSADRSQLLEPLAFAQLAALHHAEAITTFCQLLKLKPNCASALMGRGTAYYQIGDYKAAVQDLRKSIEIEPRHAFPRKYLGALYFDRAEFDQATIELNKAADLDSLDPFIRKVRGRLNFERGEYQKAQADFSVALKVDPNDIESLTGHGLSGHAIGLDLHQAEADFAKAVKFGSGEKDNAYLWCNLAQVQMELGEVDTAYKNLSRAVELDPNFCEARSHRAFLLANSPASNKRTLELAKEDVRIAFASTEPRTFWDYQAAAAVNAALGDLQRAIKFQNLAEDAVRKTGPKRFVEVAARAKSRYEQMANKINGRK
jgi:tetratricopeptide (TPR) repeat protein